jgi:uncharacterized SAM-binding protein YcdF (DUF218 family)
MLTRRKLWLVLATFFICTAALWFFRAPLLRSMASLWIVDDKPTRADAIIILGGGLRYRPYAAARLYRAGLSPTVLIAGVKPATDERLGMALSETERARRILLSNGVPESAIQVLGSGVFSTYDEAEAARAWARQNNAKALLIPTDLFHTRRAQWIFDKVIASDIPGFQSHVTAIAPEEYSKSNWWQQEHGLIAFQSELIKWCYYHWHY